MRRFNALTGFGCISTTGRTGRLLKWDGRFNALTGFGCISTDCIDYHMVRRKEKLSFNALTGFGCISTERHIGTLGCSDNL